MRLLLATTYAFGVVLLSACDEPPQERVLSGPTMGTTYTVKVVGAPVGLDSHDLKVAIEAILQQVDAGMSTYRSDSHISRFNATTSTDWFGVSAELASVVTSALIVSKESAGAFDITVAPLVATWGFGAAGRPDSLPDADTLAQLGAHVGYRKLHVRADPPALRKDSAQLTVDLNAIAPGFAVDRLAEHLLSLRLENFMVDIGGEVRAHGRNAHGMPWRIAVERPIDVERSPQAIVYLRDAAVATSGEYRHYYIRDGRRYSHTVDPRTHRPIEHGLGAVVVIAADATRADAWATALNVLGAREGYALAARRGLAAMFIEPDETGWRSRSTPPFERYLASRHEPVTREPSR